MSVRIGIRPAQRWDIEALLEMGLHMWGESSYSRIPFDRAQARAYIEARVDSGLVFVDAHEMKGAIVGQIAPFFFSINRQAIVEMFYVKPEFRGGWTSIGLYRAFEREAKKQGAGEIVLSESTGIDPELFKRFAEALKFEPTGQTFRKILNGA